jgi:putative nucleotidyltransferase with HDIG domain
MMFAILVALNYLVASDRMMLGFYVLPTVISAYFYGRRHATLTAFASTLLVILIVYFNPRLLAEQGPVRLIAEKWWDITIWGGTLMVTGYAMGTLFEKKETLIRELSDANKELRETHEREEALISELREANKELRETHEREEALISELRNANKELHDAYVGVLSILQQFIAQDEYTEHHSWRVRAYAAVIAEYMDFDSERIEDVKDASLLHDIGKIKTSRELLHRASRLTESEYKEIKQHAKKGADFIRPAGGRAGGRLGRIIPIILAHHDKFDGSGYHPTQGEEIPLEARIISVADAYDAMISDRPYRKAMSSLDAKETINKGSGTDFDPTVVKAFLKAYQSGALEIDFTYLEMRRH